eukprot:GHVO01034306.1.p1 GENE.GHVO01034306.1~~GHVO01034306.1.p1  ORF type:complete len:293 (+),score=37.59 GHVO01034306.1:83-961(+)
MQSTKHSASRKMAHGNTTPRSNGRQPPQDGETLARDLLSYFQNEVKDVSIMCHGETFVANRIFLCARSPVFKAMLSGDFVEGLTQNIDINDFEPTVVEAFLEFVRTDSCSLLRDGTIKDLLDLYLLADKYQFGALCRRCEHRIMAMINRNNVLFVLTAAEATGKVAMKKKCMEVLQSMRGAELLCVMRGVDIWDDVRDMRITVESLTATDRPKAQLSISCCVFDTVDILKQKILEKWCIAVEGQKLVFSGTLLEDGRTLRESNIIDGSRIFLLEGIRRKHVNSLISKIFRKK